MLSFAEQWRQEELKTMNMDELKRQLWLVEAEIDRRLFRENKLFDINKLNK